MNASTQGFLHPPSSLLTEVSNPVTKKTDYAFPLQTKAWLEMQGVIRTALGFPIDQKDFVELYGSFSDEGTLIQAIDILKTIQKTSALYGDPLMLIEKLSEFEKSSSAPDPIYGNAVWLSYSTQTSAQNISGLLKEGIDDIGKSPDPKTRIDELTELLWGQKVDGKLPPKPEKGTIIYQGSALKTQIDAFSTKVTSFYTLFNAQLTGPTNSLQWYLDQSDNILQDAENLEENDKKAIKRIKDKIDKLNAEYIGFTVAASASPLFLLIPFFGPFLAVADAATFAALAIEVKKDIGAAEKNLATQEKDKRQKAALVTQLGGFNTSSLNVEKEGKNFLAAIQQLISGWTEFERQVQNQLDNITVQDVSDWNAFLTKINFESALDAWNLIAAKAESFAETGFVKFSTTSTLAETT